MRVAVCHAARQFRHISHKNLIFIAPENDDFKAFQGSYLQLVFDDDSSDLLDLIGLGVGAIALKVDQFGNTGLAEHVMAALDANLKAQVGKEAAQFTMATKPGGHLIRTAHRAIALTLRRAGTQGEVGALVYVDPCGKLAAAQDPYRTVEAIAGLGRRTNRACCRPEPDHQSFLFG